jgi:hypothetical protein
MAAMLVRWRRGAADGWRKGRRAGCVDDADDATREDGGGEKASTNRAFVVVVVVATRMTRMTTAMDIDAALDIRLFGTT